MPDSIPVKNGHYTFVIPALYRSTPTGPVETIFVAFLPRRGSYGASFLQFNSFSTNTEYNPAKRNPSQSYLQKFIEHRTVNCKRKTSPTSPVYTYCSSGSGPVIFYQGQ